MTVAEIHNAKPASGPQNEASKFLYLQNYLIKKKQLLLIKINYFAVINFCLFLLNNIISFTAFVDVGLNLDSDDDIFEPSQRARSTKHSRGRKRHFDLMQILVSK